MRPALCTLTLLALAAPVRADDACLGGPSTLADQRALATLRASTETACPCASYTGARGHTRSAYQKCARHALRTALGTSTPRATCRRMAMEMNRGATCGTRKAVACGEVHTGGRKPLTCAVKATARCRDRRGVTAGACTAETHCADVLAWTAGTCVDVRALGPHGVGVRTVRLTKKSVVDPTADRILDTLVWYPAPAGLAAPLQPGLRGVLDAPFERSGAPYPLLMFSHGSCGYPAQSTFLTPLLASYGFIVVAPPHPGNTLFDGAACATGQVASAAERPDDIVFALDQMLAANGDPSSPFYQTIDPRRLGMSGHSFGGFDTYRVVARDSRFKVAMPLAPFVGGSPILKIPSLTMFGTIDSAVPLDPLKKAYADAQPPKLLVEIANAGHYAFSNACFPGPDCMPPATLTQPEAHDIVLRWVLPFLEVYLAGDARFAPFLDTPPGPGVTVQHAS